jgi:hypothetical protein
MPHNIRMHLTGYSGLRPLPPAGDAERWTNKPGRAAAIEGQRNDDPLTTPKSAIVSTVCRKEPLMGTGAFLSRHVVRLTLGVVVLAGLLPDVVAARLTSD